MGMPDILVLFEALSVTLQILALLFNGAIICTVWKKSLLQFPSNRFVFSLCLCHLVASIVNITISIISPLFPQHETDVGAAVGEDDDLVCVDQSTPLTHIVMFFTFSVSLCTTITVAVISIERYVTIARPMKYKSIVTPRRSVAVVCICWFISIVVVTLPFITLSTKSKLCGSFAVPTEDLALYFAVVFSCVTISSLSIMIICYIHIFLIAKEKCQKVQIGQFASPVSSISSDWPSSAYSSAEGHKWMHPNSRMTSSNSLLHWVLMANLGRHAQPLRVPYLMKAVEPTSARHASHHHSHHQTSHSQMQNSSPVVVPTSLAPSGVNPSAMGDVTKYHGGSPSPIPKRRKWKSFLLHNYNSPRKTVVTILLIIGSVLLTQIPLTVVLFTRLEEHSRLFYFCSSVLTSFASLSNPILYGFLNRSIRVQLWKMLKIRHQSKKVRQIGVNGNFVAVRNVGSKKDSVSSGDGNGFSPTSTITSNHLARWNSPRRETIFGLVELDRKNNRTSVDVDIDDGNASAEIGTQGLRLNHPLPMTMLQKRSASVGFAEDDLNCLAGFPRKPSQDSGADMTFSEDEEEEECDKVVVGYERRRSSTRFMRAVMSRSRSGSIVSKSPSRSVTTVSTQTQTTTPLVTTSLMTMAQCHPRVVRSPSMSVLVETHCLSTDRHRPPRLSHLAQTVLRASEQMTLLDDIRFPTKGRFPVDVPLRKKLSLKKAILEYHAEDPIET